MNDVHKRHMNKAILPNIIYKGQYVLYSAVIKDFKIVHVRKDFIKAKE